MGSDDEIDVASAGPAPRPNPSTNVAGAAVEATAPVATAEVAGVADVAAGLASGRIDATAAQSLLIDSVIAEQLPANAPPDQVEALRAELVTLLSGDPTLERLLS